MLTLLKTNTLEMHIATINITAKSPILLKVKHRLIKYSIEKKPELPL